MSQCHFPLFFLYLMISFRSYIKHLKECFIKYPNASKLVKKFTVPHFFNRNPLFGAWMF